MPLKKWLLQYIIALPIIFILLAGVQYLKGRELVYCLEFGASWSVISITVFALRRAYNYHKNVYCAVCNDLPKHNKAR
ncbi:hypothetical protein ATS75_15860 [Pseudoalteromonas sp. H105]|nr:hypothetical protein ATS75_15860 [Pseudoalteromonas sp. H105]